jgi:hypothetical protein
MVDLVGVSALAIALGKSKGTISKHADKGKIPVADRDKSGAPLFDVEQVRAVYDSNMNVAMRRTGGAVEPPAPPELEDEADDSPDELEQTERRSVSSAPAAPREPSGLLRQQVVEKQLKNRRLLRAIGEDEGRLVLRAIVEEEQVTAARKTRDSILAFFADRASAAYAFAGQPRTEAEWRVWLSEQATEAFNRHAATLALEAEDGDEFSDEQSDAPGSRETHAAGVD